MPFTRRALAAAVLAPAALAQTPTPDEDLKAARDRIKANGEVLAKQEIPMSTEPAFQFKA